MSILLELSTLNKFTLKLKELLSNILAAEIEIKVSEPRFPSELSKALSKSTGSTLPLISLLLSNQKEGASSKLFG